MISKCWRTYFLFVCAVVLFQGCESSLTEAPDDSQTLDGPIDGLTASEQRRFIAGDQQFNDKVFSASTGLGPVFVATSCGGCHPADGKGHPFTTLTRMGQYDTTGNHYMEYGAPQLQHRALPGYQPEAIPQGATVTRLVAPANTGLGLIEEVDDNTILEFADPDDANGDGISGRPNWIHPPAYATPSATHARNAAGAYIGRFGKKAAVFNLLQQTAGAYNQDIGVVSIFEPIDPYTRQSADPEITENELRDVVFYLRTLKAPVRRNPEDANIKAGETIFTTTGCASCHRPTLITGNSDVAALSNKMFNPYTDVLLHDMGPELDDGYTEGTAMTAEWRTPALWGIGLSKKSQGGKLFLMHDGRATSYRDAIMLHGGEGSKSRETFSRLTEQEKNFLYLFLDSL